MESNVNKPKFSKLRRDILSYSLDFLEYFEVHDLRKIKSRLLQNAIRTKKPTEAFKKCLMEMKERDGKKHKKYDYPPLCFKVHPKKNLKSNSKFSYFCEKCSNFNCDQCLKEAKEKQIASNIANYTCKDKKVHKGSLKRFDYSCFSCNFALCGFCINNHKPGKLIMISDLKKFCHFKESEEIKKLQDLAINYRKFVDSLSCFVNETTYQICSKYESHLKDKPTLVETCLEDVKNNFKEKIQIKFDNVTALIILNNYESHYIEKLQLNQNEYAEMIKNRFMHCVRKELFKNNAFTSDCQACLNAEKNEAGSDSKCQYCQSTHLKFIANWSGGPWSGDPGTHEYRCLHCLSEFILYEG